MDIDKLDFTQRDGLAVFLDFSQDEDDFLYQYNRTETDMDFAYCSEAFAYMERVRLYRTRFNNSMPIPIRKQLLRDMLDGAGTD